MNKHQEKKIEVLKYAIKRIRDEEIEDKFGKANSNRISLYKQIDEIKDFFELIRTEKELDTGEKVECDKIITTIRRLIFKMSKKELSDIYHFEEIRDLLG